MPILCRVSISQYNLKFLHCRLCPRYLFQCHPHHFSLLMNFSNSCASKYTTPIFVVRRPSSVQVLSVATSVHRFCKSSIALSCIMLRDYRKATNLNFWGIVMDIWEAKSPHTLSYTYRQSSFPTSSRLGAFKTIASISTVLCLYNLAIRLDESSVFIQSQLQHITVQEHLFGEFSPASLTFCPCTSATDTFPFTYQFSSVSIPISQTLNCSTICAVETF